MKRSLLLVAACAVFLSAANVAYGCACNGTTAVSVPAYPFVGEGSVVADARWAAVPAWDIYAE